MDSHIAALTVADLATSYRDHPEDAVAIQQRLLRDELQAVLKHWDYQRLQPVQRAAVLAKLIEEM